VPEAVIIGSERSEVGLPTGMEVLARGGSALDAVEAAMRCCEDNLADHYVGTGGLPNAQGEVELDASVMLGSNRRFGSVGALRGYPNPISVARAVLEGLPQHCMLVGAGAALFARENGFRPAELLTDESKALWREQLQAPGESVEGENTAAVDGDELYRRTALDLVRRLAPHEGPWGTVNIIALDASGELCVGVSTSGYPFKYPGRVGDSAVRGGLHRPRRAEHARRHRPQYRRPARHRRRPLRGLPYGTGRGRDAPRRLPRRTARPGPHPRRPPRRRRQPAGQHLRRDDRALPRAATAPQNSAVKQGPLRCR
jgi:hypothetical protein